MRERDQEADDRQKAAEDRHNAAEDRRAAAVDRRTAAEDRRAAELDRKAFSSALQVGSLEGAVAIISNPCGTMPWRPAGMPSGPSRCLAFREHAMPLAKNFAILPQDMKVAIAKLQ